MDTERLRERFDLRPLDLDRDLFFLGLLVLERLRRLLDLLRLLLRDFLCLLEDFCSLFFCGERLPFLRCFDGESAVDAVELRLSSDMDLAAAD